MKTHHYNLLIKQKIKTKMKVKRTILIVLVAVLIIQNSLAAQQTRTRDFGIEIGVMKPGKSNSLTDVPGVRVGHITIIQGDSIRTGVTAIIPAEGNLFQNKLPAAIYIANGFGKLAGYSQVRELGNIETPIILTNTLSVSAGIEGLVKYTLNQKGNERVRSVNAIVGETNDSHLNDIRGMHVRPAHILEAINLASTDPVQEGNVGAGTGTVCFGYKGGIGSSSRVLPESLGGHTIGVLVQSNFGGVLEINGIPVAKKFKAYPFYDEIQKQTDGSCMIVIITNAPVSSRNLERLAKRAILGLGKTGGIVSNGSGDYIIAVSNFEANRIQYQSDQRIELKSEIRNDEMTSLFLAVIEATEEAIINSLFSAEDMCGNRGNCVKALDPNQILKLRN